ncbi:MAG: Gfo/Idh/MocA family oxidoreductase [Planctomycetes bacterium]|nr:Gfo/Idh/MocA family oxidoreductase [Planctomycetota bacterium]
MAMHTNRRSFLKTTAAAGAGYWAAGGVAPRPSRSAIETVDFASVGVGGKGSSDSADAGASGNMVAICDIDDRNLDRAAAKWPQAKKYHDFRKMLEEMGSSIDAVTVSTPDHTHAAASLMAMRMGKACFTQKPLTHSIFEARRLAEVAREKKVATQMGNQGTAETNLRTSAALIKAGVIGRVKEVHVWTNRPVWPQGLSKPTDAQECPKEVHWDEFIGPAKFRPYHPAYHPFKWRGWWDFGTGALGDMACHTLNMAYMALMLKDPVSIVAETSGHNGETYPAWSVITFEYPELKGRAPVKMMWYDGGKKPDPKLLPPREAFKDEKGDAVIRDAREYAAVMERGCLVIGEKGSLLSPEDYGGDAAHTGVWFDGKEFVLQRNIKDPKVEVKVSPGHFKEWVDAIKGGEPAMSNFPEYSGGLTETVLLGNLAVWAAAAPGVGKKIEWDAATTTAKNAPEVAHIIKPEFREGYTI